MSESRQRTTGRYTARSAVGSLILLVAACSAAPAQSTRAECEAAGGKWGRFGLRQQELCDLPAPDAGKACTDSKDCASACIAPDAALVASTSEGKCFGRMLLLGTCLKQVRGGVVAPPLCAD
jgi:hypothetical protein